MKLKSVSQALNQGGDRLSDHQSVMATRLAQENRNLSNEIARLRFKVLELEQAADSDPLLPVYNRRAFMREMSRAQTMTTRYNIISSVIFFDLNGFKAINDNHGHAVGDYLLKQVSAVLTEGVRDCDMVARLGGDEFGVLLFKSDIDIAAAKAAALSCRIAEQVVETERDNVSVTAAWGVAKCDPDEEIDEVLDRADREMYKAKAVQKIARG
ncbi:diguanylate cyclase (GGDEF)-like protein [Litorimonas taeanensis]|uniref:diguanylate cyclase n=1 Tax=Litorimonas taeanensis TaxID=568099 RepID=A0A420WF67_9PROT|nr:GGDEF domain-containing protein [Litorimonas taeanensis]RKQ69622.1 diguanylate cyclase (GGDEF)-like protein [Litorimonas taeanensis]